MKINSVEGFKKEAISNQEFQERLLIFVILDFLAILLAFLSKQ